MFLILDSGVFFLEIHLGIIYDSGILVRLVMIQVFWLGVVLFNLCKQTGQNWFNLLLYCLLQVCCQFRDLRYGDRVWRNSVTNIIETKNRPTKGTYQFSMFEYELKFGCSFSFFRCFVVNINSYGMICIQKCIIVKAFQT